MDDLRRALESLSPTARNTLRRVLIRDQADRDAIASILLGYGDAAGYEWADLIDALTINPDLRRDLVLVLGELKAGSA
jgi:hypothetical protein